MQVFDQLIAIVQKDDGVAQMVLIGGVEGIVLRAGNALGGKELPEPAGEQLGLGHFPLLQPPPPTGVEGRVPNQQVGGTGAEGEIGKGRDERLALGRGEI